MDELYGTGVMFAFIIGLVKICISISYAFSVRAQNLGKIGLYYSYMNGTFNASTKPTAWHLLGFLVYMLVVAPVFSWFSVASAAWTTVSWLSRRTSVPEAVKTAQYKIANVSLSKVQMIEIQEELSRIIGIDGPIRTGAAEEADEDYKYNRNVWEFEYGRVTVDPKSKTMTFDSHTDDWHGEFYSLYEYRFEGTQLMTRLLEDRNEWLGKEEWQVRDGVVLESEMRARDAEKSIKFDPVDKKIAALRAQTEWHEYRSADVRFFVMKNHPDLFPHRDLRRLIRAEIERLKAGAIAMRAEAQRLGLEVSDTDEGVAIRYPKDFPEDKKPAVEELFSDISLQKFGIKSGELSYIRKAEAELLKLLGETEAA